MTITDLVNLAVNALLGGLLLFLATQLIKRNGWPSWTKLALSWILAAVFALCTAWQQGDVVTIVHTWHDGLTMQAFLTYFVTYWTAASIWYRGIFKGTSWSQNLAAFPKRA